MRRYLYNPSVRDSKLAKFRKFRSEIRDLEFLGRLRVESCA